MNLKAQRAALLKAAQDIVSAAAKAGRDLTADEIADIEAKTAEIRELDVKIADAAKAADLIAALGALPDDEDETPISGGKSAKSLGDHFVKAMADSGRSLRDAGTFRAAEFKAATDTQVVGANTGAFGPLITDVDRSFVLPYRRRLVVADLLGEGTVSGTAITYPVFGALEGESAFIAEGSQKPQIHVADPTWVTDALGEVAGWFKLTDNMLEDLPYVVSEINSTLLYDLMLKEEMALLSGNGTAPNLRGILNRSGIQTLPKAADSDPDRIFQAISDVQEVTGFSADGIVINPADYAAIRLSKDANGQYFGGGFFTGQYGNGALMEQPPLWGLRTVVTSSITAGTVLVGAFATAAKVFRKGGVQVESTNSHQDDFTNDKVTIRAKARLGLQVKYPAAFVKVTLGKSA